MTTSTPDPGPAGLADAATRRVVAVAGATGAVGTHLVHALETQQLGAVPLSRAVSVDLLSATELDDALAGVDTVIDVSNVVPTRRGQRVESFSRATNTLTAGRRAGARHHVVSIVGAAALHHSYYAGKLAQEEIVRAASTPHPVRRATKFHEFAGQMLDRMRFGPWPPSRRCARRAPTSSGPPLRHGHLRPLAPGPACQGFARNRDLRRDV